LIPVRPREQHEARHSARRREQRPTFAKQYARREGIEATISASAFVPLACVVGALLDWRRPICNRLALPQLSMWTGR
jgi:hypothetical protein